MLSLNAPHSSGPLNVTQGGAAFTAPSPHKPRGSGVDRPITAHIQVRLFCSASGRDKASLSRPLKHLGTETWWFFRRPPSSELFSPASQRISGRAGIPPSGSLCSAELGGQTPPSLHLSTKGFDRRSPAPMFP